MSQSRENLWGYNRNTNKVFPYTRFADGVVNLPLTEMREAKKYLITGFVFQDQAEAIGKLSA